MSALNAITSFIDTTHKRISQFLLYGGVLLMASMTLAVIVQVLMRYVLSQPISWIEEYCYYAMFSMVLMGTPYLFLYKLSICMTLFYDKLHSPKKKLIIDCVFNIAIIVSTAILFPDLIDTVVKNYSVASAQLPLSKGQILSIAPLSFVLIITVTVGNIVKDIALYLRGSHAVESLNDAEELDRDI